MSIAEKLTTVSENVPKVYEAGKQAEYDRFWDTYQVNGTRTTYSYVFCGYGWTDEVYQPKYNLDSVKNVNNMYFYSRITDTKLPINLTGVNNGNTSAMFQGASTLKTIRTLTVAENTTYANTFNNCTELENITFEGTIAANGLNFQWSTKLTHDSLMSLINALADKTGDTSGTTWKVTIGATNYAKLTTEEIEIAEEKGWTLE